MNVSILFRLAKIEMQLRLRRMSTVIALLLVIAMTWAMVLDQSTGKSMLVVNSARTLYTSSALAMGSVTLCAMLMGLIGFI